MRFDSLLGQVEGWNEKSIRPGGTNRKLHYQASKGRLTLPVILSANVQSLQNKMDEIHGLIHKQRYAWDCSVLCFCETWLGEDTPDAAVKPASYMLWGDRDAERNGKSCGGGIAISDTVTLNSLGAQTARSFHISAQRMCNI